jgi:hypothetical protein
MKAYGARYLGDLRSFVQAYLLSLIAILPMILLSFGLAGFAPYLFLALFGGINIVAVAALTAVFENYPYKFLVHLLAVGANAFWMREIFAFQSAPNLPNLNLVLFCQVVFLMGLFYAIRQRHKIGAQLRKYLDAES